jgi:NADH-quinone oxidoreductase subunit M
MATELAVPWLLCLTVVPFLAAALCQRATPRRQHLLARAATVLDLVLAAATAWEFQQRGAALLVDPWDPLRLLTGQPLLQLDALNAPLPAFLALLHCAATLVAPRDPAQRPTAGRLLASLGLGQAIVLCPRPAFLALLWGLGMLPLARQLADADPHTARAHRVFQRYMGMSTGLFALGAAGLELAPQTAPGPAICLLVAIMIRKGVFPLHSWLPAAFEHGPLAGLILFCTPQVGAYAAARLLLPHAPELVLLLVGVLGVLTGIYGAGAALVQPNARRAFGYLFMGQSALVMAGLECTSLAGLTGGLALWLSCGTALAGLGFSLWVLEARRGPLALDRLHGNHQRMPLLSLAFLCFGLASVGFPGTLGFIGQELLAEGATTALPRVGFGVVAAVALGGIAVLRMYFALFCGPPATTSLEQGLRRREVVGFTLLLAPLLAGGLLPAAFVGSRTEAATVLLARRAATTGTPVPGTGATRPAAGQPTAHRPLQVD